MHNISPGDGITLTKILTIEADIEDAEYQVYVTLTHEWGEVISERQLATRDSALNYSIAYTEVELSSNGIYKVKWEVIISGATSVSFDTVRVNTVYANDLQFFEKYPFLDNDFNNQAFAEIERQIRSIINTYCGQKFEYYTGLSISTDGANGRSLMMPVKLNNFNLVVIANDDDYNITDLVEKTPESDWFIRFKSSTSKFRSTNTFTITGDWGWQYVPPEVTMASELLIAEQLSDDNGYRAHAVTDIYMDTHRMRIDDRIAFNSTGNIDADVLLMDYIKLGFEWM